MDEDQRFSYFDDPLDKHGTKVEVFSEYAYSEMRDLMQRVALKSKRFGCRARNNARISEDLSEHHMALSTHARSINILFGFMNIVCIGHPLLQYDVVVNKHFLNKYKIKMGHTYMKDRNPSFLYDFMKFVHNPPKCGGDALKTAEAAQWILFYPKSVAFIGSCPGNNDMDEILYCIEEMSVTHNLDVKADLKTSYHLIMRYGKRWSEVFIIDPISPCMSLQFIDSPHVASILEQSQLIFISGRSCLQMNMGLAGLAQFTSSRFKTLCIQISEGLSLEETQEALLMLFKYLDLLFLSKKKAKELIKKFNIPVPLMSCLGLTAKKAALSIWRWMKAMARKSVSVILYDGIKKAYVASDSEGHSIKIYPSKFYKASNVVDLFGYESAFSGGFLAQMVQGSEIGACIDCAFFSASAVATQKGAHFPINRLELFMKWQSVEDSNDINGCKQQIFSRKR